MSPSGSPSTRPMRCVCASMKPGSKVTSPRSMTFAPEGMRTDLLSPTEVILSLVTMTTAFVIGAAPVPSIKRAAFNTTTPLPSEGSGRMPMGAGFCGSTETHRQEIKISAKRNCLEVLISRLPRVGLVDRPKNGGAHSSLDFVHAPALLICSLWRYLCRNQSLLSAFQELSR